MLGDAPRWKLLLGKVKAVRIRDFFQLWAKCSVFSSACWQANLQRCKCTKQSCFDWGRQVAACGLHWPCFHPVGLCQQTLANSNLPFKNGDHLTCKHQNLWTFHLPSSSTGCFTFTAIKMVLRAKQIYGNRRETQRSDWQTSEILAVTYCWHESQKLASVCKVCIVK